MTSKDVEQLRATFAAELRERVAALDALLERLAEPGADGDELRRAAFEEAHRLKGAAGTLRLERLASVAGEVAAAFGGDRPGPLDVAAARGQLAAAAEDQLVLPAEPPAGTGGDAVTVLHVEDDPVTARLVERALAREAGVTLVTAAEGSEAIELARHLRPHLVLLDLHLPDMAGADVVDWLRQDPATAEIPVVLTTGGGDADEVDRLLAEGVGAYLEKPLDFGQLRDLVGSFRRRPG